MEMISTFYEKDEINVYFKNHFIFKAKNGQFLEEETTLEAELPT